MGSYFKNVVLVRLIEYNHALYFESYEANGNARGKVDVEAAVKAADLARAIDRALPERAKARWRWRILYIRAILDEIRYNRYERGLAGEGAGANWSSALRGVDDAEPYLRELLVLYHCDKVADPEKRHGHFAVRPPL